MKLSKNFSLSEITYSSTAKRLGIDNAPNKKHLQNIQNLITKVVQPIRNHIGAIRISSGYRSPVLNRAIGGSNKSQHCKGEALDLQYWENGEMNNKKLYDWIIDNGVEFDQMINELNGQNIFGGILSGATFFFFGLNFNKFFFPKSE